MKVHLCFAHRSYSYTFRPFCGTLLMSQIFTSNGENNSRHDFMNKISDSLGLIQYFRWYSCMKNIFETISAKSD